MWKQVIDPFNNILWSSLIASVPVIVIFWALIIKKMKGYLASLLAVSVAILIAIVAYGMPAKLALISTAHGALYGLFPICWIVIATIFLFNITIKSGQFEVIKNFMASITSDRRIQALLIAFSFGAFLEGTAGFGAPVAITAAMLVGLGFKPLYAAGICLIANTVPVAFGAIGIPITVASQISGLPEMDISRLVGRTLPFLSFLLPFYLIILMAGLKRTFEIWPAIIVSGLSFALFQFFTSNFIGPALPDIAAGIGSIICLFVFLRFWKPRSVWHFKNEPDIVITNQPNYTSGQILRAWSPFILLTIMIIGWGIAPIKDLIDSGTLSFQIPGLHNAILDEDNNPLTKVFKLNYLSAAGTAIFISAIISVPLIGLSFKEAWTTFMETMKQLKYPIITIAAILGFAFVANDSGITITMGTGLASTGKLFPFFAPILGWLGTFITGSDTSSNALFSKLQMVTGESIGVNPLLTVSGNATGGVIGKMLSPQSIAVATASVGLVGQEASLFRFTAKHSFIILMTVCLFVFAQTYWIPGIVPESTAGIAEAAAVNSRSTGWACLWGLITVLAGFILLTVLMNRKRKK